ncbi:MAG TPA: hypothetical protein VEV16_05540 [Daejeonella sp.]|nr:hypothetical protein [Daejeonella sp.]
MKNKIKIIVALVGISSTAMTNAQESCKVLLPAIAEKYDGGCNNGKAQGNGKAEGVDTYEGEFKGGLPDGRGSYIWKNGDVYEGQWIKGKREGEGQMNIKRNGKADSVLTGFWKNNSYVGKYEKPFKVHFRSSQFASIVISKNTRGNNNNNSILFTVQSTSGGSQGLNTGPVPRPEISDILVQQGDFLNSTTEPSGPKATAKKLNEVRYPFRAIVKIGSQEADIEIFEPGEWNIQINLNN